jgi:hypothetical protein
MCIPPFKPQSLAFSTVASEMGSERQRLGKPIFQRTSLCVQAGTKRKGKLKHLQSGPLNKKHSKPHPRQHSDNRESKKRKPIEELLTSARAPFSRDRSPAGTSSFGLTTGMVRERALFTAPRSTLRPQQHGIQPPQQGLRFDELVLIAQQANDGTLPTPYPANQLENRGLLEGVV